MRTPLGLAFMLSALPLSAQTSAEAEARMFTISAGYEAYMGRWSRLLVPGYLAFVEAHDGQRFLDVGTGTAALTGAIEARFASSEVVGVDPSAGFIGFARKNAQSPRAQFEVGDAQALRFGDAAFDQTMSLLVMNFIPDHDKAIREMRRVTRPGGLVSACVWDYNEGMQSLRFFWDEVVALDPAMEPKDERHMKLSRQGQLGELWKKANFIDIREQPITIDQAFASFDDYW